MKTWILRSALLVIVLALLGGIGTYVFIQRAVIDMFGGRTSTAQVAAGAPDAERVVILNANVLTPDSDAFVQGQAVILDAGLIDYVGPEPDMRGDPRIVDGRGMYLVPGFTDSHVHLWRSENDLLLYVANGVTQVREMHGTRRHLEWRDEIGGGRIGPDLFVVAAQLATYDTIEGIWQRLTSERNVVRSDNDVRRTIGALTRADFDAIKASSFLSLSAYRAASRQIEATGAKFVGHIPPAASLDDLWASEQAEVSHVEEFVKALDREFGGYTSTNSDEFLAFVRSRSDDVAQRVRANGIAVTTTLALIESFGPQATGLENVLRSTQLEYVNPGLVEGQAMGWLPSVNGYRVPEHRRTDGWESRQTTYWAAYAEAQRILFQALVRADVVLLAGTDANVPAMVPGFSLHQEMIAMQAAGMTPAQVLASATSAPGTWSGQRTGQIRRGYEADLVLLRDDPLLDIDATDAIEMVFTNGRSFDRNELNGLLGAVRTANGESRQQSIDQFQ